MIVMLNVDISDVCVAGIGVVVVFVVDVFGCVVL